MSIINSMSITCSIITADQHYQDKATGKHILSGTFSMYYSIKENENLGCGVYASVEGINFPTNLNLFLLESSTSTERLIAKWSIQNQKDNDEDSIEVGIQLVLPFRNFGKYKLILKHEDVEIGSRTIHYKKVEE